MKYVAPEMEIVRFETIEVLAASNIVDACPVDGLSNPETDQD